MISNKYKLIKDAKFKKVIYCLSCNEILNETIELNGIELWDKWIRIVSSAGLNTPGCRKCGACTSAGYNINTKSRIIMVDGNLDVEFTDAIKKLTGEFYEEQYNDVCKCKDVKDEHLFINKTDSCVYGPVHIICGKWTQPYEDKL